jgi:hypothetical protein
MWKKHWRREVIEVIDVEEDLKKVELVKEKAKVGWAEASEALEAAGGDIVGALAWLEERDKRTNWTERLAVQGEEIINVFSRVIKEGNVTRVVLKKDDRVVLDVPLTLTLVGVVLAPALAILSMLVALGSQCTMELERWGKRQGPAGTAQKEWRQEEE